MLAFLLVFYFLLACGLAWVALFPEGRLFAVTLARATTGVWRTAVSSVRGTPRQVSGVLDTHSRALTAVTRSFGLWIARHKWVLGLAAVLLIAPPVVIVLTSSHPYLDGFSGERAPVNPQVAALLAGEQLVPPLPLPPDIFMATEVQQVRPLLISASRNWQLLDPEFAQRILLIFKIMREQHGYEMAILEGYRSPERQDMLARMGAQVTNAKAFQSYHQYGLAADCAFVRDGKLVISEQDPWAMRGYALYGQVAESAGLHWGGRWKMLDFGHAELRRSGVMNAAR